MATMNDEERKHSEPILLRLTPGQRDLVDQAAEHAGLSRSGWMRAALLREARRELAEAPSLG